MVSDRERERQAEKLLAIILGDENELGLCHRIAVIRQRFRQEEYPAVQEGEDGEDSRRKSFRPPEASTAA